MMFIPSILRTFQVKRVFSKCSVKRSVKYLVYGFPPALSLYDVWNFMHVCIILRLCLMV